MGILVYFSAKYLFGSNTTAAGLAAIPFVLGILEIGTDIAAAISVILIISALSWYAAPPEYKSEAKKFIANAADENSTASNHTQ